MGLAMLAAAYLAALGLVRATNLSHAERYRQWPFPLLAVPFCLVLALRAASLARGPLARWGRLVARVAPFSGLAPQGIVTCLLNLLALASFAALKLLVGRVIIPLWTIPGPRSLLAPMYRYAYDYDDRAKEWSLKSRFRGLTRPLGWLHGLLSSFALGALLITAIGPLAQVPLLHVALPIVVGELLFYLDPPRAAKREEPPDDEDAGDTCDQAALQRSFARTFPDRVLGLRSRTRQPEEPRPCDALIEELMSSDDHEERLAGTYAAAVRDALAAWSAPAVPDAPPQLFQRLGFEGRDTLDPEQIRTMVRLLKRQNVIFATPFFGDYREFLFFPASRSLLQGQRVLVLCGEGDLLAEVRAWVEEGLHAATSVPGLWRVETLGPHGESLPDVGILEGFRLNDAPFVEDIAGFLSEVGFVILLFPSVLLSRAQVGLSHLAHLLPDPALVTYAAFDVNADGLLDSLSHMARDPFFEVLPSGSPAARDFGATWRVEGEGVQGRALGNVSRYLGSGAEVAALSFSGGAPQVEWSAGHAVPLKDLRWLSDQYAPELRAHEARDGALDDLRQALVLHEGLWLARVGRDAHHIVEDELCNSWEMARQYATRATHGSTVSVLSGNYLLRDFMRYNERLGFPDRRALPLTVADHERSLRNYLVELMGVLVCRDVEVSEVLERLAVLGVAQEDEDDSSLPTRLAEWVAERGLLDEAGLSAFAPWIERGRAVAVEGSVRPERRDFLTLGSEAARARVRAGSSHLACAYYVDEDEREPGRELGSCLLGHVWQRMQPGQFVTLRGKYYEVLSVTPEAGVLLRRAGDHFERRLWYRQVREVRLTACSPRPFGRPPQPRRLAQGETNVDIALIQANVEVLTTGYLRMVDYGDVEGSVFVRAEGSEGDGRRRRYPNKQVLRVAFEGASDAQLVTVAAVLNELLRTVYAQDYEYLFVVPALSGGQGAPEGLLGVVPALLEVQGDAPCRGPALYVVEDSLVDIGLVSSFERNAEHLLALAWRYLSWHWAMLEDGPALDPSGDYHVSPEHLLGDTDLVRDVRDDGEAETEFEEPPSARETEADGLLVRGPAGVRPEPDGEESVPDSDGEELELGGDEPQPAKEGPLGGNAAEQTEG